MLGAGSQADEAEEFAPAGSVIFRAVSREFMASIPGPVIDIATADPQFTELPVVAAVGAPGLRRMLVAQWRGRTYRSIIATTDVSPTVSIGAGSIIAPGAVLTAGVRVGSHVIVNVGATISHRTRIGDFATVSPGVNIAGDCTIEAGAFLGIGSTIVHGVTVATGSVIGAGAVVVADILEPGVYVGVPARQLRITTDWLLSI